MCEFDWKVISRRDDFVLFYTWNLYTINIKKKCYLFNTFRTRHEIGCWLHTYRLVIWIYCELCVDRMETKIIENKIIWKQKKLWKKYVNFCYRNNDWMKNDKRHLHQCHQHIFINMLLRFLQDKYLNRYHRVRWTFKKHVLFHTKLQKMRIKPKKKRMKK